MLSVCGKLLPAVKFSAELTCLPTQIIIDSAQKAAAIVERLNEETLNKELEALGLPRATIIQGRSNGWSLRELVRS